MVHIHFWVVQHFERASGRILQAVPDDMKSTDVCIGFTILCISKHGTLQGSFEAFED